MSPSRAQVIRHLHELIAALDRRVPHVERAGEASIARDAADLRSRAVKRIADLERENSVEPSPSGRAPKKPSGR